MNNRRKEQTISIAAAIAAYALLFAAWELAIPVLHISPITLVPPSQIFPLLFTQKTAYLAALLYTFREVGWGWLIGNFFGLMAAVALYRFRDLSKTLVSLSVIVNAIPLVALSAIIAGFMGTGPGSKITVAALICFFPMFISALTGFTRIPENEERLFDTYAGSAAQKFLHLVLPSGAPFIMTAAKLNVLNAMFAAITAEFFGAYGGIGQLILANRGLYNLGMVWGAIFYVVAGGVLFYFAVSMIQKQVVFWKR